MLVALIAVPAAFAQHGAARQTRLQTLDLGVLVQLNAIRTSHGLMPLKLNPALSTAAGGHSSEMLADGYFAHVSADGSAFWKRVQVYYASAGFGFWSSERT